MAERKVEHENEWIIKEIIKIEKDVISELEKCEEVNRKYKTDFVTAQIATYEKCLEIIHKHKPYIVDGIQFGVNMPICKHLNKDWLGYSNEGSIYQCRNCKWLFVI